MYLVNGRKVGRTTTTLFLRAYRNPLKSPSLPPPLLVGYRVTSVAGVKTVGRSDRVVVVRAEEVRVRGYTDDTRWLSRRGFGGAARRRGVVITTVGGGSRKRIRVTT